MRAGDRLVRTWELLSMLVRKELKLRYQGTLLGVAWSIANPVALALVLYFAFKVVFVVPIDDYPLFLLAALFPWQWISNSVSTAPLVFISHASLIRKLPFPRAVLCVATVLGDMIHFLISLVLFVALLLLSKGSWPTAVWLVGVPLIAGLQAIITIGIVLAIATANALLRDLEHLVRIGLLLLFYVTPILYPLSMVPDELQWLTLLNPLAPLVIAWRALLLDNTLSPYIVASAVHAAVLLCASLSVYRGLGWRVPEVA
jgi:lipopolysaccharide transport system permease protein